MSRNTRQSAASGASTGAIAAALTDAAKTEAPVAASEGVSTPADAELLRLQRHLKEVLEQSEIDQGYIAMMETNLKALEDALAAASPPQPEPGQIVVEYVNANNVVARAAFDDIDGAISELKIWRRDAHLDAAEAAGMEVHR